MILTQKNGEKIWLTVEDGAFYQICNIRYTGRTDNKLPRMRIVGDWLNEIGFTTGALIQTLPEPDGLVFNLCNENVDYSDLYRSTKAQGGTLIRVHTMNEPGRYKAPAFATTGKHLLKGGLEIDDTLLAKCEYGCIRMRKVVGNVHLVNVARTKHLRTKAPVPMAHLGGEWLTVAGFTPDTLFSITSEQGCITLTAYDKSVVYSDIVMLARKNKMRLKQVYEKDGNPLITITGLSVENAGFELGDIFAAEYEYGVVKLRKLDPQRFDF